MPVTEILQPLNPFSPTPIARHQSRRILPAARFVVHGFGFMTAGHFVTETSLSSDVIWNLAPDFVESRPGPSPGREGFVMPTLLYWAV